VGPKNTITDAPTWCKETQIQSHGCILFALGWDIRGCILRVHMNKRTLLNNVRQLQQMCVCFHCNPEA
jgi:hypothetical protein